jgi:hypothetical protein
MSQLYIDKENIDFQRCQESMAKSGLDSWVFVGAMLLVVGLGTTTEESRAAVRSSGLSKSATTALKPAMTRMVAVLSGC